jgi:hypothetical protein
MKILLVLTLSMFTFGAFADDECTLTVDADGVKTAERVCAIQGAKDNDKLKSLYTSCECDKLKEAEPDMKSVYSVESQCSTDRNLKATTSDGETIMLHKAGGTAE